MSLVGDRFDKSDSEFARQRRGEVDETSGGRFPLPPYKGGPLPVPTPPTLIKRETLIAVPEHALKAGEQIAVACAAPTGPYRIIVLWRRTGDKSVSRTVRTSLPGQLAHQSSGALVRIEARSDGGLLHIVAIPQEGAAVYGIYMESA